MLTPKEAYIMKGANAFEMPNPLHRFASYNTIFTLSGITEQEIRDGTYLKDNLHDVIARTGGIGPDGFRSAYRVNEINSRKGGPVGGDRILDRLRNRNQKYTGSKTIQERHHDIFLENVNILSVISPNVERNLSNFKKMEFEIHEPYGITFIEKVRAATFNSGFLDYQDAPLLLTIEFKGFDENGKPLESGMRETRKIPILIARVEFDVNEGGARYSVVAVPYSDVGFDDRFKVLRTRVDITSNSFYTLGKKKGWKDIFEKALADQMEQEIKEKVREFPDKYILELDDKVITRNVYKYAFTLNSALGGETVGDLYTFPTGQPTDGDQTQTADSGTTVVKAFEDWLRNHPGFFSIASDFWRAYLTMAGYKLPEDEQDRTLAINSLLTSKEKENELQGLLLKYQYVPWFKIKSTVFTDTTRLDRVTKMHPKTIVYKAIPYKIHVLKLLATGLSIGKVDWSKLVRKNYDYIYTGSNVDVQNLRISYKSAYYMRNVRGDDKTENDSQLVKAVKQGFNFVFGNETYPEPLLPLRSYPSNIKGRSTLENFKTGGNKAQEFFDYLTNPEADMMRIELDILGDPQYICQDVLATLKQINDKKTDQVIKIDADFDEQSGSFNGDQYMTLINLRYRLPADINEKEGTMFSGIDQVKDENLFFNGIYQVVRVDSKFDQGQFTQTLTCVRMNNQQGKGSAPDVFLSAFKRDYIEEKKDEIKDNLKKKVLDKIEDYLE